MLAKCVYVCVGGWVSVSACLKVCFYCLLCPFLLNYLLDIIIQLLLTAGAQNNVYVMEKDLSSEVT